MCEGGGDRYTSYFNFVHIIVKQYYHVFKRRGRVILILILILISNKQVHIYDMID